MMKAFDFRCPRADLKVRVLKAARSPAGARQGISVICLACGRVHIVVPATGKCLGTMPEPEHATRDGGRC
jgi:hypothetical protein